MTDFLYLLRNGTGPLLFSPRASRSISLKVVVVVVLLVVVVVVVSVVTFCKNSQIKRIVGSTYRWRIYVLVPY